MKAKALSVKNTGNLGISDLASGGQGRLVIYTENAIKELKEKFAGGNKAK